MNDFQICPNCGRRTPEENLRCIFCGDRLPVGRGTLGSFRFGRGRAIFIIVALLVVFFFLRLYMR